MTSQTKHKAPRRRLWQAVVARAMAFVLFLTLVVPVPASAAGLDLNASSIAITNSTGFGSAGATGDPVDGGLVQHTHCVCHSAVRLGFETLPVRRLTPDAPLPLEAAAQPRPAPASLPFKPPRSA